MKVLSLVAGPARLLYHVATNRRVRRSWLLRLTRPANLFQPEIDTLPNRYPEVFALLKHTLGDDSSVKVLSFGCSTGEEVFSLRDYLTSATITGLDISRGNIADCRRRLGVSPDPRIRFEVAGATDRLATDHFDAILCMAVLRHADLSYSQAPCCDHRVTFAAFDRTVVDFARCLKPGGLLVIEHSNFRFSDTSVAGAFECVLRMEKSFDPRIPLFGPDNRRLPVPSYGEVAFRKRRAPGEAASG